VGRAARLPGSGGKPSLDPLRTVPANGSALALNAYARKAANRLTEPVGRGLARAGVNANVLTLAGLVVTLAGVAVIVTGEVRWGAVVVAVGTLADMFDGAVARVRGTAGPFGAFVDSVTDRVSDAALLGAAAWLVRDDALLFFVALTALAGAQLTSYIRAKAESLGWNATVGIFERAERVVILVLAFFFDLVAIALWVLALGAVVTVAQRLWVVRRQARTGQDTLTPPEAR
jgi:CDP-diacylglycerol---glycerol-3-phosphate 3-phosphatidyltransferase